MAQLGFVVLTVDARGTPERGKAFQDVVYRNFGRHEIPDHAAAIRQLAARRPYLDTTRVGIYGISWGGYMSVRAMVLAPELYQVAAPTFAVADLWDHWADPIEPYMSLPQQNREGYEYASSLRLADKIRGGMLVIAATSDVNATFSASMKLVEALTRAGKPYRLKVYLEQNHAFDGIYRDWHEAVARFFEEHLRP
jgi:dipeptidyl aminopeptidase/acylaminoacyl peptidase